MAGPLSSLKVLDFSTLLPGPFASMYLADLGAEVVRVEGPQRPDPIRSMPPFDGGTSVWHALLGRSKRSIAIDLKNPDAPEIINRLVQDYDIVLEQFRPGVMDRLGIGYDAIRAANPSVIYCALTGYGQTGPLRERAGHDINYLSLAGVAHTIGSKTTGPIPLGVQVADVGAGSLTLLVGLLAAVIHRATTGQGQFVDVSMHAGSISWNSIQAMAALATGSDPGREESVLNGGTFYNFYRTSDGQYMSVGSLEPKFWRTLCDTLDRDDLYELGMSTKAKDQSFVIDALRREFAGATRDEWTERFAEVDACVEPVLTASEALQHPQAGARGMLVDVPAAAGSMQSQVSNPLLFSETEAEYKYVGAAFGEHTDQVLGETGYSSEEIRAMRASGLIA